MATSLGYKLFKTESLEDMPFEQFKVLLYATQKMHEELRDTAESTIGSTPGTTRKKSTTFRIHNED